MVNQLKDIFVDETIINRIKIRLPHLFQIAEIESSRAGKIGMQVGSIRENILVALLIYKYGHENVETEIKITEPEIDVKLFGQPISIKTVTSKTFGGVKLIWAVDAKKARQFRESYFPKYDMLLIRINWGGNGGFYHIPSEIQKELFESIGREDYIKLPKPGTNPRGVEITNKALSELATNKLTNVIDINWEKEDISYDPVERWVDYWSKE